MQTNYALACQYVVNKNNVLMGCSAAELAMMAYGLLVQVRMDRPWTSSTHQRTFGRRKEQFAAAVQSRSFARLWLVAGERRDSQTWTTHHILLPRCFINSLLWRSANQWQQQSNRKERDQNALLSKRKTTKIILYNNKGSWLRLIHRPSSSSYSKSHHQLRAYLGWRRSSGKDRFAVNATLTLRCLYRKSLR